MSQKLYFRENGEIILKNVSIFQKKIVPLQTEL